VAIKNFGFVELNSGQESALSLNAYLVKRLGTGSREGQYAVAAWPALRAAFRRRAPLLLYSNRGLAYGKHQHKCLSDAIDEFVTDLDETVRLLRQTTAVLARIRALTLPSEIEKEATEAIEKNRESTNQVCAVCAHMAEVMLNLEETLKANTLQ
jgi:hypothetical protein